MLTINPSIRAAAENYNTRPIGTRVTSIIVHYTVGDLASCLAFIQLPQARVSWHYTVAKNGDIYQHVGESLRAWHAGESAYGGHVDFNDFSIGIELENNGREAYTDAQYSALAWLVSDIAGRQPIDATLVLGHEQVAIPAGRKHDPGPLFDWARLRSGVPRLWPQQQVWPTGFAIAMWAQAAWQGVQIDGYPISAVQQGQGGLLVQWFERARLELHPDGSISRGRVGAEAYSK